MLRLLLIFCLAVLQAGAIGFEDYEDHHPVPCGSIITFEDDAEYLRNVYVSLSGSDSGDGSLQAPYRTLAAAAANALPGDTIHMLAGTYSGGFSISSLSGTRARPIQILGHGAVFQGGTNCIQFSRCSYLIIRNITCRGATHNGLNVDDGSDYGNPQASHHLIFDRLHIHNIGSGGNNDNLKLSGIRDFFVLNSHFHDSGAGSGIDMVGCHNGIIAYNRMENMGSNFVQAKGGSANITIHGNVLRGAEHRGLNMGGSTGAEYFRPPISAMAEAYEARHIRATANIISEVMAGVAYVGCDECLVANNVIYRTSRWPIRILQETTTLNGRTFVPSRRGEFVNNIVVIDSSVSSVVNIGPSTEPSSFRFSHNMWHHLDNPSYPGPDLPTQETGRLLGDPGFVSAPTDFRLMPGSSALSSAEPGWVAADIGGACFFGEIGAYSAGCIPSWQCSEWSECTAGQQARNCTDLNACQPLRQETRACSVACVHEADIPPCDGCIMQTELQAYIHAWKHGNSSLTNLMLAIRLWKAGC